MLPKTCAETVEERRKELTETTGDEYLKIVSYTAYDEFPEVKPFQEKPENIRFFEDGLEILINKHSSSRVIVQGDIDRGGHIEPSPIDTTYNFRLIDEKRKRILEYSIDAVNGEY